MNKALCCNSALLILLCAPLKAQENMNDLPSMAFLEYLADMEEVDGKLYGPQDINLKPCSSLDSAQEKQDGTSNKINGVQHDKPPKNEEPEIKQECKNHD